MQLECSIVNTKRHGHGTHKRSIWRSPVQLVIWSPVRSCALAITSPLAEWPGPQIHFVVISTMKLKTPSKIYYSLILERIHCLLKTLGQRADISPSLPSQLDSMVSSVCSGFLAGLSQQGDKQAQLLLRNAVSGPAIPKVSVRVCCVRFFWEATGNKHSRSHPKTPRSEPA